MRASELGGALPASREIGELLRLLDKVLAEAPDGRGGVMADALAMRRKVARVKSGFEALRALDARGNSGTGRVMGSRGERVADGAMNVGTATGTPSRQDALALVAEIKRAELRFEIGCLATEALAYQALPMPDEHPGDNEAPVGGAYAQLARRVILAGFYEPAAATSALRDRLARLLLPES